MSPWKNPFPGMNPFLEKRWGDIHARLASYAADSIQERLPTDLRARMQERVFIESPRQALDGPPAAFSPDVHVYKIPSAKGASSSPGTATAIDAGPIIIQLAETEITEPYLEIIDAGSGGRVITTIEFVSRSNKRSGSGRRDYLRKRKNSIKAKVNVVEIDLLRGGRAVTLAAPESVSALRTPYHACVWRASKPAHLEYYPMPLPLKLRIISIPLRPADADVKLDLQSLIDEAFFRGRYDDIDYTAPLDPPLSIEDLAWVSELTSTR